MCRKLLAENVDYMDVFYFDPGIEINVPDIQKRAKKGGSGKKKTLTIQKRVENPAQAAELGKSGLHAANSKEQTANIEIMGCPLIAAGQTIELSGFGQFSGKYFVASAIHRVSGSSAYATNIEMTIPAPTETVSAGDEKSEAAEAAKEEVIQEDLDRKSGVIVYPPGQYPLTDEALLLLEAARENVNEFLIQAQSSTEEERIQAERD